MQQALNVDGSTHVFNKFYKLEKMSVVFLKGVLEKTLLSSLVSPIDTLCKCVSSRLPLFSSYTQISVKNVEVFLEKLAERNQQLKAKVLSIVTETLDSSARLALLAEICLEWMAMIFFVVAGLHQDLKHLAIQATWRPWLFLMSLVRSDSDDRCLKEKIDFLWQKLESAVDILKEYIAEAGQMYLTHTFENPHLYFGKRIMAALCWVKYRELPEDIWSSDLVKLEEFFDQVKMYETTDDCLILEKIGTLTRKSI